MGGKCYIQSFVWAWFYMRGPPLRVSFVAMPAAIALPPSTKSFTVLVSLTILSIPYLLLSFSFRFFRKMRTFHQKTVPPNSAPHSALPGMIAPMYPAVAHWYGAGSQPVSSRRTCRTASAHEYCSTISWTPWFQGVFIRSFCILISFLYCNFVASRGRLRISQNCAVWKILVIYS